MKKWKTAIALACAMLLACSNTTWAEEQTDDSISTALNDAAGGNYGLLTQEQKNATEAKIRAFKETYIRDWMSEVEKEIQIIRYLVQNTQFENREGACGTAYDALVLGKAKCAGYADAFLHMAQACGLEAKYILSDTHAWNLVKLNGNWYHVDVTWEDPTVEGSCSSGDGSCNGYGFGELRSKFINLTDEEIKNYKGHQNWYPDTEAAVSKEYGLKKILSLISEFDINDYGTTVENANQRMGEVLKYSGARQFTFTTKEALSEEVSKYVSERIDNREGMLYILVRYLKGTNQLECLEAEREVRKNVAAMVREKYYHGEAIFKSVPLLNFDLYDDGSGGYYATEVRNVRFNYKEGVETKKYHYTIRYIDKNGQQVGLQTGMAAGQEQVNFQYPEGYSFISSRPETYRKIKGESFQQLRDPEQGITMGHADCEIEITVK